MRNKIYILLILLVIITLVGCSKVKEINNNDNTIINQEEKDKQEEKKEEEKEEKIEEEYIDNNNIKIALYNGNNGVYKRLDRYESKVKEMEVINTFSIILSNEEEVSGYSIKKIYNKMIENIPDINNYKVGYNVKFKITDGREINVNVLKPLEYFEYEFSPYLYAWIYDDIHANGWHSHIEKNEYTDDTIMSSFKLMWGKSSNEIASDIELSVFTYDADDFDNNGNYRGNSKFTTIIVGK